MDKEINMEVDKYYLDSLSGYTSILEKSIVTSHSTSNLEAGDRRYWASIIFTRICTFSVSILYLCPKSKINPKVLHYDFGAIASLTRNLFECGLTLFYLGVEHISNDEWLTRLKVMQLNDCISRIRMHKEFDPDYPELKLAEKDAEELRSNLNKNPFFLSIPEKKRKRFLKGDDASILTRGEVLKRMGAIWEGDTRGYYIFLSSHIHSFPLGYYRMAEHGRGSGVENDVEKGYIASALEFCTNILTRCTDDMRKIFSDIVKFPLEDTYDWNILMRQ